jgi:hypothetical protein
MPFICDSAISSAVDARQGRRSLRKEKADRATPEDTGTCQSPTSRPIKGCPYIRMTLPRVRGVLRYASRQRYTEVQWELHNVNPAWLGAQNFNRSLREN